MFTLRNPSGGGQGWSVGDEVTYWTEESKRWGKGVISSLGENMAAVQGGVGGIHEVEYKNLKSPSAAVLQPKALLPTPRYCLPPPTYRPPARPPLFPVPPPGRCLLPPPPLPSEELVSPHSWQESLMTLPGKGDRWRRTSWTAGEYPSRPPPSHHHAYPRPGSRPSEDWDPSFPRLEPCSLLDSHPVPDEYMVAKVIGGKGKLPLIKLGNCHTDDLFFLFYAWVEDTTQLTTSTRWRPLPLDYRG